MNIDAAQYDLKQYIIMTKSVGKKKKIFFIELYSVSPIRIVFAMLFMRKCI